MPIDSGRFKESLSSWPSGVTVVTSAREGRVHGMTVSAFTSLSLDPPLVLFCADKASNTHSLILESAVFSVSVLSEEQEELSNRFASKEEEDRRFDGLDCPRGATGCPHIPGAVLVLDCRVVERIDAGDHVIYVGQVEAASTTGRAPLVYHQGAYRQLVATRS